MSKDRQIPKIPFPKRVGGSANLSRPHCWLPLSSLLVLLSSGASLEAQRTRSLTEQSPFIPPGFQEQIKREQEKKAKPAPAPPKPPPLIEKNLEFKGCMRLRNVWRFSIFDKRSGKSSWVRLKQKAEAGFTVIEFDEENKTIVVEANGHKEELSIKSPSGAPVPISHLKAASTAKPKPTPKTTKPATPTRKAPSAKPVPRRRIVTPSN